MVKHEAARGRPMSEPARLRVLGSLHIMDTAPESTFDALVEVGASIFDVPIALITLVDDHRQWFKARHGLDVSQTPRDIAFCAWVVASGELVVVPDAHLDPRFSANPLVTGPPLVRFYAGAPLVVNDARVGSFAVIDHVPRAFGEEDQDTLLRLARVASDAIEQRVQKVAARAREKAIQAENDREARRSKALVDAALDGIVIADALGNIVDLNPAAERLFGHSRGALIGQPLTVLSPPRLRPEQERQWAERLDSGARAALGRRIETTALHASGTEVPVEIAVSELPIDPPELALHVRDLKEQRSLEAQLLHAQKMDAVGRLAGGIAHDFNNTLSIVLSYADLLESTLEPDDPRRSDVLEITKAGNHAAKLTGQLLAFSRKQALRPRVIDVDEHLRGLSRMLARLLGPSIELSWSLDAGARVNADPGSFEQVVMNIAINARDAMPDGGKLTVSTRVVAHGGTDQPFLKLMIADSGSGMAPETAAQIFEPFFTTKGTQGTGLGLSTVLGIVEQSGGSMKVHSEIGHGTAFEIYLPASMAAPSPAPARLPRARAKGETILVVDDEDAIRIVAVRMLKARGYEVIDAASAAAAIALSAKTPGTIDLLVTDIGMPDTNGYELAERLVAARPTLEVLCMSGFIDEQLLGRIVEQGFGFMQKPFDVEILSERVREMLDARQ